MAKVVIYKCDSCFDEHANNLISLQWYSAALVFCSLSCLRDWVSREWDRQKVLP